MFLRWDDYWWIHHVWKRVVMCDFFLAWFWKLIALSLIVSKMRWFSMDPSRLEWSCLVWFVSLVPKVDCTSVKCHRPDIKVEFLQQCGLVKDVKIICRIPCLLTNVFQSKNSASSHLVALKSHSKPCPLQRHPWVMSYHYIVRGKPARQRGKLSLCCL